MERILLVDSDRSLLEILADVLASRGYSVSSVTVARDALHALRTETADLVISATQLRDMSAKELFVQIRATFPATPMIGMTSSPSIEEAVEVVRAGAADYLVKPLQTQVLLDCVARLLKETASNRPQVNERRSATAPYLEGIIGRSQIMERVFSMVRSIAQSSAPILITGETGTGKDVLALALHKASGRKAFVPVNCGAIPDHLIESELFGHVKGAFTGADRNKQGLVEAADGGTLFLDEIAELPLTLQSKLLRFLESGEFRRVGEIETRRVSVRLIAATHQDLRQAVSDRRFRQDVFFRINVLHVELPPLRLRPTDIPLLAERFLADFAARDGGQELRFSPDALAALVAYSWPGNVRELKNVIERAATMVKGSEIQVNDLPTEVAVMRWERGIPDMAANRVIPLADLEREYILDVLRRHGNNKARTAKLLGVPRRTLYRRLRSWGVE